MYNEICPSNSAQHVVKRGDTLWKLSQTYGVSIQSIISANPGVNVNNLQIGSTLCVPVATTSPTPPVACPKGAFSYTVQRGDTLWNLSQAYGVSVQSILDLNPGINPQNLQIGSSLCLPYPPAMQVSPAMQAPPAMKVSPAMQTPLNTQVSPAMQAPPATKVSPAMQTPLNTQVSPVMQAPTATKVSPAMQTPLNTQVSPVMQALPIACPKWAFPYTVQSGDTLWNLSQAYGVSVQSILDINPGVDPQNLQIGSTLCIPAAPAPASSTSNFAYLIKRGDCICRIARKFYISVESILQINPGINPGCLKAGTYIYVPINCCAKNSCRYTVRAGDTLNRIANKLNICPSDLVAANPNIDFRNLVRCQVICIPTT